MNKIAIAIHGGAGTLLKSEITDEKELEYKEALSQAINRGKEILLQGGTAIDAVEASVMSLEDNPLFNAGRGSVFNSEGKHEMDASIMEGKTLNAGAASLITNIQNPIALARCIMDKSEHVFMAGKGAMEFAKEHKFILQEDAYFYNEYRHQQWQQIKHSDSFQLDHSIDKDKKFGTVGAVALDQFGNLAAATSTGGMTNKKYGRVGDSPMIGAGTYANNKTCAVSCTGSGEFFIRGVVAYDVSCLMEYKKLTLAQACEEVIQQRLKAIRGDGGLIAIDSQGNICLEFNTEGMYRASYKTDSSIIVEIYKN